MNTVKSDRTAGSTCMTNELERRPVEGLMTVPETAAYLAVPTSWVYAHRDELPFIRLGRGLRLRRSDLDAWLIQQRRHAITRRASDSTSGQVS